MEGLPLDAEVTVIHREEGMWGSRLVFDHHEMGMIEFPITDVLEIQAARTEVGAYGRATLRSEDAVTVPVGNGGGLAGYVELSRAPDYATEALETAGQAFAYAAGGATLLAAIVGLLVGGRVTAPLRDLAAAAGEMGEGDLSIRAGVRGRDEIGQLARRFNHMAEQLEASFAELAAERDTLRRFMTDASHELRTPVTALKSFNELLQGAAAGDPAARAEFLAESRHQLERLEWITHNLLDVSRLDAGLASLEIADHEAEDLIGAVVAAFRPLAREKGVALLVDAPASLPVRCDRARIESALSNLVDNGLRYTPAGEEVTVGAKEAGESVRLWVQDGGPGVPPGERERIFERFYRGDEAHAGGAGLGLSIVRSIVEAHGGRVAVESEPGAGSCFVIELPREGKR